MTILVTTEIRGTEKQSFLFEVKLLYSQFFAQA